jgi:hypothetical protein
VSGRQTDVDDFDIQEFEGQEDRMIELACYLLVREKDRIARDWNEALGVGQEYQDYVTKHQFNYAVLMQKMQPEAWQALAEVGQQHYRNLFGQD